MKYTQHLNSFTQQQLSKSGLSRTTQKDKMKNQSGKIVGGIKKRKHEDNVEKELSVQDVKKLQDLVGKCDKFSLMNLLFLSLLFI